MMGPGPGPGELLPHAVNRLAGSVTHAMMTTHARIRNSRLSTVASRRLRKTASQDERLAEPIRNLCSGEAERLDDRAAEPGERLAQKAAPQQDVIEFEALKMGTHLFD